MVGDLWFRMICDDLTSGEIRPELGSSLWASQGPKQRLALFKPVRRLQGEKSLLQVQDQVSEAQMNNLPDIWDRWAAHFGSLLSNRVMTYFRAW